MVPERHLAVAGQTPKIGQLLLLRKNEALSRSYRELTFMTATIGRWSLAEYQSLDR
jgi:hypothetical protein